MHEGPLAPMIGSEQGHIANTACEHPEFIENLLVGMYEWSHFCEMVAA